MSEARRVLRFEVLGHPTSNARARGSVPPHPFVPSPNGNCRGGHAVMFDPATNAAAKKLVVEACLRAAKEQGFALPMTGTVEMRVAFYGRGREPDDDNLVKLVRDALNGVAYLDDGQIDRGRQRRYWGKENVPTKAHERTLIMLIENPDAPEERHDG